MTDFPVPPIAEATAPEPVTLSVWLPAVLLNVVISELLTVVVEL